eukprot:CAMPEP_0119372302 /NCGR_PEP_ID=MMETSP1334-20130426/18313_1 /TAXON_ID=127549 /ORGANISM="Calcidiscus leptoporus, Strain RCC1130" /LENGTH=89 /DNA_ID=CAMNT_0007389759 /DNA_START=380 /DNA_END=645 /DNA_ORIENTATION=-
MATLPTKADAIPSQTAPRALPRAAEAALSEARTVLPRPDFEQSCAHVMAPEKMANCEKTASSRGVDTSSAPPSSAATSANHDARACARV